MKGESQRERMLRSEIKFFKWEVSSLRITLSAYSYSSSSTDSFTSITSLFTLTA